MSSSRSSRFRTVGRATLILAFFFAIDKGLAFIRQVLIARTFGLSPELDAFNAANNLPDLLFALISGGALAMAFIPVLTEVLTLRGRRAMWRLFARIANLAFLTTAGLAVLIAIFAEPLVRWELGIAPGFTPEFQALTAQLMRLNLIATLIFSLSGLVAASLYAQQHFWLPALAPVMYNVGQIIGIAILAPEQGLRLGPVTLPSLGLGVHGLVYGVIFGALLHLGVQVPGLVRYGFRWWPEVRLHDPDVRKVLRLMGPRVLTMFFIQLVFLARDNLASSIPGAVTALAYGWFIMQVPETLIGTAMGIALLPTLSTLSAQADWDGYRRALNQGVRILVALTLPIAVLLSITMPGLLQILGLNFQDTAMVVAATRAYLAGLTGHALLELAARGFYARQDARTPLLASALTTAGYLTFAWLFRGWLGAAGIGLANATAFTAEAILLLLLTQRRFPGILRLGSTGWRTAAAVGLGAAVSTLLMHILGPTVWGGLVALLAGGALALPWVWPEVRALLQ
ncbi:MAG: murein biosynthesis integral membrane protein MurJ [Chloroflexi bacterium]|nr:murein biosynthesis integral membrane protein MurJ [Chloroflexota bacterium]